MWRRVALRIVTLGCALSAACAKRAPSSAMSPVLALGDDLLRLQPAALTFVDGGRTLVAGDRRATRYVDVETGRLLRTGPPATMLAPSPDGRQMLAAVRSAGPSGPLDYDENFIPRSRLWLIDPATGLATHRAWLPDVAPYDARWAEDGKTIWLSLYRVELEVSLSALLADQIGRSRDWRRKAARYPHRDFTLPLEEEESIRGTTRRPVNVVATARSPSGKRVALELGRGGVLIFDQPDLQHPRSFDWPGTGGIDGEIHHAIAFVGEDRLAVASGMDVEWMEPSVRLFDLRSGAVIRTFSCRAHDRVTVSPDARVLATWGSETGVQLWDVETGAERLHHTGHRGVLTTIVFAPDGKSLVTGAGDGTVRVWDARTGQERRVLDVRAGVGSLALDGTGRVALNGYQRVEVWRLGDGTRAFHTRPMGGSSTNDAIAFSRDGGTVEYHSRNGNPLYRWDLSRNVTVAEEHDPTLARLRELSPDQVDALSVDQRKAVIREKDAVVLRELPSGKELQRLTSGERPTLAIAPDGQAFAVGERDGRIIWIAGDRRRELRPWGDTEVTALAFSPDGRVLACGAVDGRAVLWRPAD